MAEPIITSASAIDVLLDARRTLRLFLQARAASAGLISPEDVAPLERLHRDVAIFDTIPRLVLAGEFKAGKSTLLNALFGIHAAAVDLFEMTAWIARYWPAPEDFCRIAMRDGTVTEANAADFLGRCEKRLHSDEYLRQIDRVDVGVSGTVLNAVLIDCPGFGSITTSNERLVQQALEYADLLIWVVDVDDIGGERGMAVLRKLLAQGVPAIVALTKCDLLRDADELAEIRRYFLTRLPLDASQVFATSALRGAAPQSVAVDGIELLRRFISNDVSMRQPEFRARARAAHIARLAEATLDSLALIEAELRRATDAVSRFRDIADALCGAVQQQVEVETETWARSQLFAGQNTRLSNELTGVLQARGGSLSREEIEHIFRRALGERFIEQFWQRLQARVSDQAASLWKDKVHELSSELEAVAEDFRTGAWSQVADQLLPGNVMQRIEDSADATLRTGVQTSLGIAAVASAWAAWLGPAAAQLTLGAAMTGIGLPVALIGIGVSLCLAQSHRRGAARNYRAEAEAALDGYARQFCQTVLAEEFFPRLAALNREIARSLVVAFERTISDHLPEGSLDQLLSEVRDARSRVSALTR